MLQLSVCTFTAFLCLTRDDPLPADGGFGSSCTYNSDTGACETLENMCIMTLPHDSGFDMSLGYIGNWLSRDCDWPRGTSSYLPFNFSMSRVSDILSRSASSTRRRDAYGKPINDLIVPASHVPLVPEDRTLLPPIQAPVRRW